MPGSWERTRLRRVRHLPHRRPSRADALEGFLFFQASRVRNRRHPAQAGGETRISGRVRAPKARGLLEGTARERFARSTDSRANQYGFARRREIHPERRDLNLFCSFRFACAAVWRLRVSGGEEHRLLREKNLPHVGGNRLDLFPRKISFDKRCGWPASRSSRVAPSAYAKASADASCTFRERRLVVKISGTSHHGKAGSNPACDGTYRGVASRGRRVAGCGAFSARKHLRCRH